MRISMVAALTAAMAFAGAPGAAQTSGDYKGTQPIPLPDTRGGDADMICFAIMSAHANEAKKAGSPNRAYDSAAGFYIGKITVRYSDAALIGADYKKLMTIQMADADLEKFTWPCMQRYAASLARAYNAMTGKELSSQ